MTATVCPPSMDDALRGSVPPEWHRTSMLAVLTLTLVPIPSAVVCGELLVRRAAGDCRLDRPSTESAVNLMTDLINHAVATTGATDPPATYDTEFGHLPLIEIGVSVSPICVLLAVADIGLAEPTVSSQLGRAATESAQWSSHEPPDGGRIVWCAQPLWPSATTVQLACRAGSPRTDGPGPPLRNH